MFREMVREKLKKKVLEGLGISELQQGVFDLQLRTRGINFEDTPKKNSNPNDGGSVFIAGGRKAGTEGNEKTPYSEHAPGVDGFVCFMDPYDKRVLVVDFDQKVLREPNEEELGHMRREEKIDW